MPWTIIFLETEFLKLQTAKTGHKMEDDCYHVLCSAFSYLNSCIFIIINTLTLHTCN